MGLDGTRLSGIGLSRENPEYYATIGRWLCNEFEAMSLADNPYTPPPEITPSDPATSHQTARTDPRAAP